MIKNLIIFILLVILVWVNKDNFSIYFSEHTLSHLKENIKRKTNDKIPKNEIVKVTKQDVKENHITTNNIAIYLADDKFYKALSFYMNHSTVKNKRMIEDYLSKLVTKNPKLALEYMHIFLENEPEANVRKLMVKIYIAKGDLSKAIELIMQERDNYISDNEDMKLSKQLKDTALKHIDRLEKREEYEPLISFLEKMIAYDSTDNLYTFRLAKLYITLDKTDEALLLLEELKDDEMYAQNAQTLIDEMNKEEEEEESYEYEIPLLNYGKHYVAQVYLDNQLYNLIVDTGATYIFVDEDKASNIGVINDNLILHTAGADIVAKLGSVSRLVVGNLELDNIKVTIAPFQRDGIDGLLGMNFFSQFSFYIDQEKNILYLNPK